MANLSNINNILRISSSGVGLNKDNTGPSELDIESAGADMIDMTRTGQKTYRFAISGASAFSLFDVAANADRLVIDGSGNSTFAGDVAINGSLLELGSFNQFSGIDTSDLVLSVDKNNVGGGSSFDIQMDGTTSAFYINNSRNVGIGTASPQVPLQIGTHLATAPTDTGLCVSNRKSIRINDADGSYSFGVYIKQNYSGSSYLILGTRHNGADTDALFVKSGNVGIGTDSPEGKFDVVDGNAIMTFKTGSSDRPYLQLRHDAVPVDGEELAIMDFSGFNDASQNTRYGIIIGKAEDVTDGSEDGSMNFLTMKAGTATNTLILRSGNVGIGTSSPGYKLSVANASTRIISATYIDGANGIMSHAGAPNYGLESFQVRGDFISFWTDYDASHYQGTEKMRIDQSGNVGIGYDSPSSFNQRVNAPHLVVGSGSNSAGLTIYSGTVSQGSINFADGLTTTDQYTGGIIYVHGSDNYMSFHTNGGTERMRISSNGRTLITVASGNTIQDSTLQLKATGASDNAGIMFINTGNTSSFNDIAGIASFVDSGSAKGNLQFWTRNSDGDNSDVATRMRITSGGAVQIGTTNSGSKLNVGGTIAAATNDLSNGMIVPRSLGLSHPGNTGTFTRTFNPVTLFGMGARGGQVLFECTGWQMAMNNGYIMWRNAGGADPIGTSGSVQYVQTAYVSGAQGSNTIAVSLNGVGSNDITITFTGWHGNSHGFMCRITTNYM